MKTLLLTYIITNGQCIGMLNKNNNGIITNAICNIKVKRQSIYRKATKKETKQYLKLIGHKL